MEVLEHTFCEPFEIAGAFATVLQDSRPFERDQTTFHHFVKHRQERVDLLLRVANFNDYRTLIGANVMRFMKPAGMSKAEGAFQDRRPGEVHLPRFHHDRTIKRFFNAISIVDTHEDAQQDRLVRYIHFWFLSGALL